MNVIELQNLTKSFGQVKAVNDLSLSVPKGSIYGFIGPNGSGKTTTLRMIMRIMYPDSGTIFINGNLLSSSKPENIPLWQPIVGMLLVIFFTLFTVWLGARIFRTAILIQGQKPTLGRLFNYAFRYK